jgi:hypothetical protein
LNLRNSSDETKEQIESLPDKALIEIFQEHILEEAKLENNPSIKIPGAKKLTKKNIMPIYSKRSNGESWRMQSLSNRSTG